MVAILGCTNSNQNQWRQDWPMIGITETTNLFMPVVSIFWDNCCYWISWQLYWCQCRYVIKSLTGAKLSLGRRTKFIANSLLSGQALKLLLTILHIKFTLEFTYTLYMRQFCLNNFVRVYTFYPAFWFWTMWTETRKYRIFTRPRGDTEFFSGVCCADS